MRTQFKTIVIICCGLFYNVYTCFIYFAVYVNSQCGQTTPLSFDGQLSVHLNPRYWTRNTSCAVTVASTSNTMLYFEEFEVDCRNGYVTVTDENNNYVNGRCMSIYFSLIHTNIGRLKLIDTCIMFIAVKFNGMY